MSQISKRNEGSLEILYRLNLRVQDELKDSANYQKLVSAFQ